MKLPTDVVNIIYDYYYSLMHVHNTNKIHTEMLIRKNIRPVRYMLHIARLHSLSFPTYEYKNIDTHFPYIEQNI